MCGMESNKADSRACPVYIEEIKKKTKKVRERPKITKIVRKRRAKKDYGGSGPSKQQ